MDIKKGGRQQFVGVFWHAGLAVREHLPGIELIFKLLLARSNSTVIEYWQVAGLFPGYP